MIPRAFAAMLAAMLGGACSNEAPSAGSTVGSPKSEWDVFDNPYTPAPDCTLQCQECAPLFAGRHFCDPEGEVWFCDTDAAACPDAPATGWPRWTLVPAACDCVQEDGTLLDSAECKGGR